MASNSSYPEHLINIHYLPVDSRLHYIIGHVVFRSRLKGCMETNESIALIFGKSVETVKRDLKVLKRDGYIEIINGGMPGKRIIKPTQKTIEFLKQNTQQIIDGKRVKNDPLKAVEEGQISPSYKVNSDPQQGQILPSNKVKNDPHNRNTKKKLIKEIEKKDTPPFLSDLENPISLDQPLDSERCIKATKRIADFFNLSEVRTQRNYMLVGNFVRYLEGKGKMDDLADQFTAYRKIKEKEPKFKHNFQNYIGTPEKSYEDGMWCDKDWVKALKDSEYTGAPHKLSYSIAESITKTLNLASE